MRGESGFGARFSYNPAIVQARRDGNLKAHVRGINSLRFVAALWVAVAHGAGLPLRQLFQGGGPLSRAISQANDVAFNGSAAVVVFFVVSGFCIHLPFVQADRIDIREYLVRRYVRIGGPLIAVLLVIHLWSNPAARAALDVLWSVYCELAYYTLYPLLFPIFRRYGFKLAIASATTISALLIATHWHYMYPWQFGALTFVTAFPAWLLGCLIAEKITNNDLMEFNGSIWYWRAGAWIYSVCALLGVFHSPIRVGFPATLLIFAFYCYFWLQQELRRWRLRTPSPWLEAAGVWSYSMYLVHKIVIAAFGELQWPIPALLNWALLVSAMLLISYIFYALIERPSHSAARRLGRSLDHPVVAPIGGV
jgi:peptidoglycan/LPS O-acetylase OafA/YrhL